MNALLTAIALWLSVNFALPTTTELPRIEFVPAQKIAALRFGALLGAQPEMGSGSSLAGQRDVVAVYEATTKTIYLRDNWTGDNPAELSVLVHEMVHHLQNAGNLKFECPQEREQAAYAAQERWLGLFGHDLQRDFEIDSFTLLVSTKCIP